MTGTGGPAGGTEELDAAFTDTVRRTGASVGGLYLLAPEERTLRLTLLSGAPVQLAVPWVRVPLAMPTPLADAFRQDRIVWVAGPEEMARSYPRAALALLHPLALLAAPVAGVRPWGALVLIWPASRPPYMTGRERSNISASCHRLARALEATAERGRPPVGPMPLRLLPVASGHPAAEPGLVATDFIERLPGGSCALDLEGRFTYLSSGACELLGGEAERLLGTLPWQSLRWLDDAAYEDHYRGAVLSREPTSFTVRRPPAQWLVFHLYPDASGISVRVLPGQPEATRPASGDATRSARAGHLYQLTHLAAGLTEVVGVQDVIDLVAEQIVPALGAQGLVLSTADAGRLHVTGHRGYSPRDIERLDGVPLDSDVTPAGRALSLGRAEFFGSPEELRRHYPAAAALSGKQAWAFLPLLSSGRPVGVCVFSYERPHRFRAEERAVMTSLAGLVAQALDRARLYDVKHELAHGLQQALLPGTLPAVAGLRVAARYLPATWGMDIGGDFYDLIPLGDTAVAAVIGDVQGHNVAAAALMGQVRTGVHSHATAGTAPDEVLARINRLLVDIGPDLFTSCLYARIDLSAGVMSLATAGHPPPLLRVPDRGIRPVEAPPGPLLGVVADAVFPVTEVPLAAGFLLTFYTDGLIERPGVDLDEAVSGLAGHLGEADVSDLDVLVDRLLRRTASTGYRTDDIALLALLHTAGGGPS
ncbi:MULTISPECIES: SpoIIE family protein phosphatase [unclassified Streptomyces]|uniref:SpoIIE family protein phosphatase n=1 Tax=unclassified Streptomyces TaxID=2593676 RepID=UPI00190506CA|nr:SpoIIE family protein phosphatase [Streptomyces sp. HSG2]